MIKSAQHISRAPAAQRAEPHKQPIYGKQKETHELIFSWLSWLAVLLVGAQHDGGGGDDDDGGVAQDGCHTRNNRLTGTCNLGLLCTSLVLDIHVMIN